MKRIIITLCICTAWVASTYAQYPYTLKKCLEEGLANNYSIRITRNDSDKVTDTQPSVKSRCSHFQRKQKIRNLLLSRKGSDFHGLVHLQGLEPWAH